MKISLCLGKVFDQHVEMVFDRMFSRFDCRFNVFLVTYSGDKSKIAVEICNIEVEGLKPIAEKFLWVSEHIDSYLFTYKSSFNYEIFKKLVRNGNPFHPHEKELKIGYITIAPAHNHTKIFVEIKVKPLF